MSPGRKAGYATTILKDPQEVYRFWRDWTHLVQASRHLRQVEEIGENRTRWTAEGPNGPVTWEADTLEDRPGERLAWRSIPGSEVEHLGEVDFVKAPGGRGTEVYVTMRYDVPGGVLGDLWAKLTGNSPEQEVAETMRRLKAMLECGEIPVVEGQPSSIMRGDPAKAEQSRKVGLR